MFICIYYVKETQSCFYNMCLTAAINVEEKATCLLAVLPNCCYNARKGFLQLQTHLYQPAVFRKMWFGYVISSTWQCVNNYCMHACLIVNPKISRMGSSEPIYYWFCWWRGYFSKGNPDKFSKLRRRQRTFINKTNIDNNTWQQHSDGRRRQSRARGRVDCC